jgi:hypothetical protein
MESKLKNNITYASINGNRFKGIYIWDVIRKPRFAEYVSGARLRFI